MSTPDSPAGRAPGAGDWRASGTGSPNTPSRGQITARESEEKENELKLLKSGVRGGKINSDRYYTVLWFSQRQRVAAE